MLQHLDGDGVELRRGDEEPLALRLEVCKQFRDAGVGRIVEPAVLQVILAELCGRGVHVLRRDEARERVGQRRADEERQLAPVAHDAVGAQRVLPGLHDAGAGVGQRTVEVKQEDVPAHPTNSSTQRR